MTANILAYAIEFTIQTGFLLAALWMMIKLQKLNHRFLPLLGSAALASGLDMIPVVGHYVAVGVLLFCIWKITQSEYVDAAFTVFVGYALMFGMNLWLIGSLLGDLRASARSADEMPSSDELLVEFDTESENPVLPPPPASRTEIAVPTNETKSALSLAGDAIARDINLKGLCRNSTNSSLIVHTGVKAYTLVLGESLLVMTRKGRVPLCFEALGEKSVVLKIDGKSTTFPL